MHAVVLSFPGHFLQTILCVRSLQKHYPEITQITFILDDVECHAWQDYCTDFCQVMQHELSIPWQVKKTSTLDLVSSCVAGWWRQQLVKFTVDQILDDDQWFVVDGDVIFDSRCEIWHHVPVTRTHDETANFSKMCLNYVRNLLGITQGCLDMDGYPVVSSPVPFRYLDRIFLQSLRQHVESRFGKDFVRLHLDWFADQTIVADINPPDRMVMSEWELMECYRRYVQGIEWPFQVTGSGYSIDIDTADKQQGKNLFRHSYQRDSEIGLAWFRDHAVNVTDDVWAKSLAWYHAQPTSAPQ